MGWKSRFHCDERQVAQYRHGRVFLAGDAAHVHSPMGGQGMNTGIQDAANLAWKLDAALAGAHDSVLDSYHDERHPIGKRVLLQSGLMARGITLHPRVARGIRNLLAPRLLRVPRLRDAIAGSFAGTTLRYPHTKGESPLVGTRATQIPLSQGRLTQLQRHFPGFVFVRERGTPPVDVGEALQVERADGGPAVLVRPDGYVAWAGDSGDRAAWAAAFTRWSGTVAIVSAAEPGETGRHRPPVAIVSAAEPGETGRHRPPVAMAIVSAAEPGETGRHRLVNLAAPPQHPVFEGPEGGVAELAQPRQQHDRKQHHIGTPGVLAVD
jgi:hypothetical protein